MIGGAETNGSSPWDSRTEVEPRAHMQWRAGILVGHGTPVLGSPWGAHPGSRLISGEMKGSRTQRPPGERGYNTRDWTFSWARLGGPTSDLPRRILQAVPGAGVFGRATEKRCHGVFA